MGTGCMAAAWVSLGPLLHVLLHSLSLFPGGRAATGTADVKTQDKAATAAAGRIPFFAAGISSVMHPKNPFAPTMHFNYR